MQCMISKSNVKFMGEEWHLAQGDVKTWLDVSLLQKDICQCFFNNLKIKLFLDSVFVISGIIKVLVSVISLCLRLWLITHTLTLIIPDITKTSSNNNDIV